MVQFCGISRPNAPPLPYPPLHFMEEREFCRGCPGGSVKMRPSAEEATDRSRWPSPTPSKPDRLV